jgi:two-component system OmpR family response regulator
VTHTVAIVEDDPDQRENCAAALRRHGYRVLGFGDRASAAHALGRAPADLVILDIMLGDDFDGGFALCRELLAADPALPVIFLTSRADDIDRISGLRLGAWDYQAKPVSLPFLAERVASLFRIRDSRRDAAPGAARSHGELELRTDAGLAHWRGVPLDLTLTEFNLLATIVVQSAGRGASYDQLAESTRQGVVENNTLNTHVLHLRNKFRAIDPDFARIRNVYGFGYRWDAT